jgi:hypothetical protein
MPNNQTLVSPIGEFGYSHLVTPGKFGHFDVELILDGDDADTFLAEMNKANDEAADSLIAAEKDPKKKKVLQSYSRREVSKAELDDAGEPTGRTIFKFKNNAEGKKKDGTTFKTRVEIVDAKKKPMANPKIGKGTIGRVAYQISPYAMSATRSIGASVRLKAVQILDLVEYGGGGASAFGEVDGYEAPEGSDIDSSEVSDSSDSPQDGDF